MKALVVIAHYFKPEQNAAHASLSETHRDARRTALEATVSGWKAISGEAAVLNIEHKKFAISKKDCSQLDIVILVNENNHLLTNEFIAAYQPQIAAVKLDNPRMLPFAAHKVMADRKRNYDWFIYTEDDLAMRDPWFFQKQQAFQREFGSTRVLQPHRYELNLRGPRLKTYIDGDLRGGFIRPFLAKHPETESVLVQETGLGTLRYERALNPHSGFFCLSATQVEAWSAAPHFMDRDCSFVSPLESAATLAILKSFSVYKTAAPDQGYLEVQHMDRRFSSLQLPLMQ